MDINTLSDITSGKFPLECNVRFFTTDTDGTLREWELFSVEEPIDQLEIILNLVPLAEEEGEDDE